MSQIRKNFILNDDEEFRQYTRYVQLEDERQRLAWAEQEMMNQLGAAQQSAEQAGALIGSASGSIDFYNGQGGGGGGSTYNYGEWYVPPPVNPNAEAQELIEGLEYVNPQYIKEIIVLEPIYMQILSILGFDTKLVNSPDLKFFKYALPYGYVMLRNEAYQFDLDKYLEQGPSEEI